MVARLIRAYGQRVGNGDVEDLAQLLALHEALETAMVTAAAQMRRNGYSWTRIGGQAGMTKQAAQQRWGAVE